VSVDVACVGAPFLDLIFRGLPRIPSPGEEVLARDLVIVPGAIANVAYALRRLGLDAVVCAPLGRDAAGRLLADLMADAGIPWVGPEAAVTPVSVALPADGDRAFVTAAPPPTVEVDAEALRALAPRAIVVDLPNVDRIPAIDPPPAVYAVVGDPEVRVLVGNLPASLGHVRAFVLNEREAMALTGSRGREPALEALVALGTTVVVTCGGAGAVAAAPDGERSSVPALDVAIEDTTGAGDLFTAAYVWSELAGRPLGARLRLASTYASLSLAAATRTRQKGVTRAELERALADRGMSELMIEEA
jgi:sugar/nucleoside kinase (ribokinase family)